MKNKPIIIIAGEPYSIFFEIYFKSLKKKSTKNIKNPIIIIGSKKLLIKQMKILKYKFKIEELNLNNINSSKLNNKKINIINVNFPHKKAFDKITSRSNPYIKNCCRIALQALKKSKSKVLINGPISKKNFLKSKYPGMTEYFASKVGKKDQEVMLIFNQKLSVSPITTHFPLKKIFNRITIKKIVKNTITLNNFYLKYFSKRPKFGIAGLNPHCESSEKYSEERKIIIPAVKVLRRKKINILGPYPSDTLFLRMNLKKFDIVIGMYHDQVLAPLKTIYGFDAINITLGLPFLRITPDHGPNISMLGKNKSNPKSFINTLEFAKKIK
tara:strand:- start:1326 stop:2306 length:981 start_codon:yes stop_codon:yes gene_type:complete